MLRKDLRLAKKLLRVASKVVKDSAQSCYQMGEGGLGIIDF